MAVELKKVHQYIKTAFNGANQINLNNSYFFKDLSNVQLNWDLVEDGKIIQSGVISKLNIGPRQTETLTVPFKTNYKDGKEYFLNIHYRLKTAEPFLEKGYDIAYEQITLAGAPKSNAPADAKFKETIKLVKTADRAIFSAKNYVITFDLKAGKLIGYKLNGVELIASGLQPSFYRAPTDNDIGAGLNTSLRMWRNVYSENSKNIIAKAYTTGDLIYLGGVEVQTELLNGDATTKQIFYIYADGSIKVENQFKAVNGNYKSLMRIGNDLQLNPAYSNINWYGRGPGENYSDRKTASLIGTYKSTVDEQYFSYARPQESGNKTRCSLGKLYQ